MPATATVSFRSPAECPPPLAPPALHCSTIEQGLSQTAGKFNFNQIPSQVRFFIVTNPSVEKIFNPLGDGKNKR